MNQNRVPGDKQEQRMYYFTTQSRSPNTKSDEISSTWKSSNQQAWKLENQESQQVFGRNLETQYKSMQVYVYKRVYNNGEDEVVRKTIWIVLLDCLKNCIYKWHNKTKKSMISVRQFKIVLPRSRIVRQTGGESR